MKAVLNTTKRKVIAAALILDIILSGVLVFLAIRSYEVAQTTRRVEVTQYEACLSANHFKEQNKEVWEGVLAFIPSDTKSGRKFHDEVTGIIDRIYVPMRCPLKP